MASSTLRIMMVIGGLFFLTICGICVALDVAARRSMDVPILGTGKFSGGTSVDIVTDDPVVHGEALYRQNCAGCHSLDESSGVGPAFAGLYGSEVRMDDGTAVYVDEDHLRRAITDPRATTRDGYPDVMPAFDDLSDEEVDALIAFIRSID